MDPGRYVLPQGWDNNSALEGYGAVHEPDFRVGGSYNSRRFPEEGFPRDNIYPRNAFHREILERDHYPPPPSVGTWPQPRRRTFDDEYALGRESRHHEKPYVDAYPEMDDFHGADKYREIDKFHPVDKFREGYRDVDGYHDPGVDRPARFGGRDRDDMGINDYEHRHRVSHHSREHSRERDYDYGRSSYDSDYERGNRRDSSWRKRDSREREHDKKSLSRERDPSPHKRRDRSWSRGRDERLRSRSPRGRSHGRSHREDSYEDSRHERSEKRRDRDEKRSYEHASVAPSATVVVKGLSQKTSEEDLYQILAEWGPLRHVRVIKERSSGISRGFAFIDFPSVEAAQTMMDGIGEDGLVVDGRKCFFEYSSKPTGGAGAPPFGQDSAVRSSYGSRSGGPPSDWMCIICGCVNFARRTSCFQCNEARGNDAPAADVSDSLGRRGSDCGPTHVLVVRGLDENADEEMLRYEFSKHAPIKDLRLVRDKFTQVSRGFAFVHFHTVEDATRALEATNGTTLEKNGQTIRVAYAKSIHGPASGASGASSSLAAAAIEAATFAQQYDAAGWAPKEYNPDEKQPVGGHEQGTSGKDNAAPQSGFVWDEASGYYFDAASGFYYDGNTGLYYDGNNGIWYTFDTQTQQYVPCVDQTEGNKASAKPTNHGSENKKAVISAPAATILSSDKAASLPDAVQAAAAAALAAEKKEKEKLKEIKLASKSSILANKKKMNNVLSMWKQRNHEGQAVGQAARLVVDDQQPSTVIDSSARKSKADTSTAQPISLDSSPVKPRPTSTLPLRGVIRGSGVGVVKSDTTFSSAMSSSVGPTTETYTAAAAATPFRTDASALGSYTPPVPSASGKRRFSEAPQPQQTQTAYRDRAAERRSLYGSSSSFGDDLSDLEDSNRKGSEMPFPPGVGGGRADVSQSFEVITADKAIDESNVGNRMLRNMGWQEGLGLGKDGSGIVEPVQAQSRDVRAGLGSQQRKPVDPSLEVQAGDSYRTLLHKKALARFREMS